MTNEEWRNHRYYKFDPFAEIPPALLNSADIVKYVEKDCLIKKEDFNIRRLKTASYEMRFLGKLYDWTRTDDGRLKKNCREVCCGDHVILPRNSIMYLWMKEKLLLPEYIAARFNLHIRCVHKGILLGTGPLIDPGFFGSLLIPLHNLTDNDYELKGGKGIIWVEFTKVSKHEFWSQPENKDNPPDLKSFPDEKDIVDPDPYFTKSDIYNKGGVQSAFKGSLDGAKKSAMDAKKSAEDAKAMADDSRKEVERGHEKFQKIGWIALATGIITIALTIGGTIWTGYNLMYDAVSRIQNSRNEALSLKIQKQDDKLKKFEADLDEIKTNLSRISNSSNESKQHHDESDGIENPQLDSVQDRQINE